jgi:hypothetical protein
MISTIKALVYAGLLSNFLAVVVCFLFHEWELMVSRSHGLAIWTLAYLFHRARGTW